MPGLVNEHARILSNKRVGPRLHILSLEAPVISRTLEPGQFIHMKVPGHSEHILRRPFSVYSSDPETATLEILYQEVGELTFILPQIEEGICEIIGPVGNTWSAPQRFEAGSCTHALLVGGGVGAAPLFLLARRLTDLSCPFDVVLGAQTSEGLVTRASYEDLLGRPTCCATDDGSYGRAGFCTSLVEERLDQGCIVDGKAYDYIAVCGPEPLMRIVAGMADSKGVFCQVSLERRMACGIGACLSCVVDTVSGKRRSCVDGPIFDAAEVIW